MADEPAASAVVMPLLDLSAIAAADPLAHAAFRRFEAAWSRGEASVEDYFNLVRLLHRVGCTEEAEYLLRTNLFANERVPVLYLELFGTVKQEEFSRAIDAFATQFSATLREEERSGLFERWYDTKPQDECLSPFRLQDEPCVVKIEYAAKDSIEAQLWSVEVEEQLIFLRWVNGRWVIIGTGVAMNVAR
jgi:hypothetical protein